jgi:hypothetical protein
LCFCRPGGFLSNPGGLFPQHPLFAFLGAVEGLEALEQFAAAGEENNRGRNERADNCACESINHEQGIHALRLTAQAASFKRRGFASTAVRTPSHPDVSPKDGEEPPRWNGCIL